MNITITQDNSRVEVLGSNGASIIEKLYELAIDPNNTLTLEGNISSATAYGYLVDYLNTNYGPDFIVNATNRYIYFEDNDVLSTLLTNNIGDGTGITEAQASLVDLNLLFRANTDITSFNEFKYFTAANKTDYGHNLMFMNCTNLSSIDLSEWEIALLRLFDGSGIITVNAPKLKTFGSSFSGYGVFLNCTLLTTVQSLGIINKIVDSMFNECTNLTTVNLPQTCTLIEQKGFCAPLNAGGGKLTTIDLSNITSIGGYAFRELRMLTKTLPDDIPNVTSIGEYAFQNCTNISGDVNYPNLTWLGQSAFTRTSILTITNLGTISTLNSTVFADCAALTSVTLPQTITTIGGMAFNNCVNLVLNLSAQSLLNVTSMGSSAFAYCRNLTGILNLPNLVGPLGGHSTFREAGISKILSLGQCSSIGEFTFQKCTNLTEAVLPTSNLTLKGECFEGCTQLSSINVDGVVSLQRLAFNDDSSLELLYFKELLDYDHSDAKTTTNNALFVGPTAYIYAPKLQNIPGGFDAGGRSVAGLFITASYYNNGPSKNIIYFKNLSSVLTGAFCGGTVKHLIINNTTPPSVTAFSNQKQNLLIDVSGAGVSRSVVQNVWVPDSAVNTYKADTYWGEFGNKIQGLSGMSKVATKALWDLLSASAKEDTLIEEYM